MKIKRKDLEYLLDNLHNAIVDFAHPALSDEHRDSYFEFLEISFDMIEHLTVQFLTSSNSIENEEFVSEN